MLRRKDRVVGTREQERERTESESSYVYRKLRELDENMLDIEKEELNKNHSIVADIILEQDQPIIIIDNLDMLKQGGAFKFILSIPFGNITGDNVYMNINDRDTLSCGYIRSHFIPGSTNYGDNGNGPLVFTVRQWARTMYSGTISKPEIDNTVNVASYGGSMSGSPTIIIQQGFAYYSGCDNVNKITLSRANNSNFPIGTRFILEAIDKSGPRGPRGLQGIQGIKGDTGAKGDKGDKGDVGDQGLQGPIGEKGDKGDKGDQGPRGLQGLQGIQGIRGEKGEQGIQGEKGDKGEDGTSLNIQPGEYREPGSTKPLPDLPDFNSTNINDAFVVDDDDIDGQYDLYIHLQNGTDWNVIDNWGGIPGPQGVDGPQGPQGIPGPEGPPGQDGEDGQDGDILPVLQSWSVLANATSNSGKPLTGKSYSVNPTAATLAERLTNTGGLRAGHPNGNTNDVVTLGYEGFFDVKHVLFLPNNYPGMDELPNIFCTGYCIASNGATGSPDGNGYFVQLLNNSVYKKQLFYKYNSTRVYTRDCVNGVWQDWKRINVDNPYSPKPDIINSIDVDWNDLIENGNYQIGIASGQPLNGPVGVYGYGNLIVDNSYRIANAIIQIYIPHRGLSTGQQIYRAMRSYYNGWSAWKYEYGNQLYGTPWNWNPYDFSSMPSLTESHWGYTNGSALNKPGTRGGFIINFPHAYNDASYTHFLFLERQASANDDSGLWLKAFANNNEYAWRRIDDNNNVKLTGNQTITGDKNFTGSLGIPVVSNIADVPTPANRIFSVTNSGQSIFRRLSGSGTAWPISYTPRSVGYYSSACWTKFAEQRATSSSTIACQLIGVNNSYGTAFFTASWRYWSASGNPNVYANVITSGRFDTFEFIGVEDSRDGTDITISWYFRNTGGEQDIWILPQFDLTVDRNTFYKFTASVFTELPEGNQYQVIKGTSANSLGVVVYDNPTGSQDGTITLSDNMSNYDKAEIFYGYTTARGQKSVTVNNPNNRRVNLDQSFNSGINATNSVVGIATECILLSGNTISRNVDNNRGFVFLNYPTNSTTNAVTQYSQNSNPGFFIYKVILYKNNVEAETVYTSDFIECINTSTNTSWANETKIPLTQKKLIGSSFSLANNEITCNRSGTLKVFADIQCNTGSTNGNMGIQVRNNDNIVMWSATAKSSGAYYQNARVSGNTIEVNAGDKITIVTWSEGGAILNRNLVDHSASVSLEYLSTVGIEDYKEDLLWSGGINLNGNSAVLNSAYTNYRKLKIYYRGTNNPTSGGIYEMETTCNVAMVSLNIDSGSVTYIRTLRLTFNGTSAVVTSNNEIWCGTGSGGANNNGTLQIYKIIGVK